MILTRSKHAGSGKVDFSWTRVVSDEGKGTQIMWRLADSVFFHMQAQSRAWHGIDASQLFWLLRTAAVEDDNIIDSRVLNLARYLDDAGIHYSPVMVNGQQVPTMDRTSWYKLMCYEARTTPDYAHKWWTALFDALPLQDPHTRRPFPCPPPRSAFPGPPDNTPQSTDLSDDSTKRRGKRLESDIQEPNYVFLPRVKTNLSDSSDEKDKKNSPSRLQKLPQLFGSSDKTRLPRDKPVAQAADGWMRRALARSSSQRSTQSLPPRPNTSTGHYEIPHAQERTTSRSTSASKRDTAPPSSFTPVRARSPSSVSRISIKSFSRSRRTSSGTASTAAPSRDTCAPVRESGNTVHRVETPELCPMEAVQTRKTRRAPLLRRHSSDAILLVSQTETVVVV